MQYLITEDQRDFIFTVLEDSTIGIVDFRKVADKLNSLPQGAPVAWITEHPRTHPTRTVSFEREDETISCFGGGCTNTPLYSHPAPFTPITVDDVTDGVIHEWHAATFGSQRLSRSKEMSDTNEQI